MMTPAATALATALWPGGLSVVVPQRSDVPWPAVLTGSAATIGLRVPDHDAPRAIARGIGPMPTTSANVTGLPEAGDAEAIGAARGCGRSRARRRTGARRAGVDGVGCSGALPRILRVGAVPVEDVAAILDRTSLEHRLREVTRAGARPAAPAVSVDAPRVDDLAVLHDQEGREQVDHRADVVRHDQHDAADVRDQPIVGELDAVIVGDARDDPAQLGDGAVPGEVLGGEVSVLAPASITNRRSATFTLVIQAATTAAGASVRSSPTRPAGGRRGRDGRALLGDRVACRFERGRCRPALIDGATPAEQ